jgi:tRNA-splicing ligase RtcB (3'-phosphate/5'-hydroxy nucleic acid ligase)
MNKLKIKAKWLLSLGFEQGPIISVAINTLEKHYKHSTLQEVEELLLQILAEPEKFTAHPYAAPIAQKLIPLFDDTIALLDKGIDYTIFGAEQIDASAIQQMELAARLPISVAAALMPDAHAGYGLPIGGVLATRHAIIPYAVGVDIGCRMALSIWDIPLAFFEKNQASFKRELLANTLFGTGNGFKGNSISEHAVLENDAFKASSLLQHLQPKAASQLGSSGTGNHFVEFGIIRISKNKNALGLAAGEYLALLTHSGSRGLGASIATEYTKIAKAVCKLPKEAQNLAYLSMDSQEGQEYWLSMNLAGDYASACHEVIHQKLAKACGAKVLVKVENHHNFAWKEIHHGEELLVHRKGATPASKNTLGIIPGSMTAPGYVVSGNGFAASLHSASHGAGRQMSRTVAKNSTTQHQLKKILADHGVTLIGGGLDESPIAYKNIELVMKHQQELVNIEATFLPKMVRMADE